MMKICRACLSTENELIRLDEIFLIKFNLLTNLSISLTEDLPQYSCEECVSTVNSFIEFRDKCISAELTIQGILQKKVKAENYEKQSTHKKEQKIEVEFDRLHNNTDDNIKIKEEVKSEIELNEYHFLNDHFGDFDGDIDIKFDYLENVKLEEFTARREKKKLKSINKKVEELKESIFLCGICPKQILDKNLLVKHLENHSKDRRCELCREVFISWPQLVSHRLVHLPTEQKKCHVCEKRSSSVINFEYHYMMNHFKGELTKMSCRKCGTTYDGPNNLRKHIWFAHSDNKFVCDVCSKEYNNKQKLQQHMITHSGVKPYVCDLCGFSCKQRGGLSGHIMRKHTSSRRYCKVCNRVFKDQQHLEGHKCTDKCKVCPICGKEYNKAQGFRRHLASHSDVSRYKCERCPATYKSSGALKEHRDKHDGNRTKHCEYCPAKFYSASVLIKHRRVHTGEKPYVCKVCQKGFTGNHNLKVHMKVHGQSLVVKKKDSEDVQLSLFANQS